MPIVAFILFFSIYPLCYAIYMSLLDYEIGKPETNFVFLDNYVKAFSDKEFATTLKNTILLLAGEIGLQIPLGLGLALLLNKDVRGIRVFRSLLLAPMVISPVIAGVIFMLFLHTAFGPVNYYIMSLFNLPRVDWRGNPSMALATVMLVDTWQWTPFVLAILLAAIQSLPLELYEAAEIDGATSVRKFRHITLPLLYPVLTTTILLRTLDVIKVFDIIYTFTFGGPGNATETLSMYIWKLAMRFYRVSYGATISFVLLIICVAIGVLFVNVLRKRLGVEL